MANPTGVLATLPGAIHRGLAKPWLMLIIPLLVVLAFAAGLRGVAKDPSVDAFVPGDHPASLARDMARDVFDLEDPMVVALAAPSGESAFTPARLEALRRIDDAVRRVPGVKKNDVLSLASQNAISGRHGDLLVDPVIEAGPVDTASAALAEQRFRSMPMLSRLLASPEGDMLIVIIPVENPSQAVATVNAVSAIAHSEGDAVATVHVAGVATMNARLAEMVDTDTRIFVPAAIVTVLLILLVALRNVKALLGPLLVIAASAAAAIGLMGWIGSSYYLITTALPVVIMAIAVADSLHISVFYLQARRGNPELSAREAARSALEHTVAPITLTTITTIAAFIGLSLGAAMRPISEFGLYAAVGVAAAWGLSLIALPAVMVLTDLKPRAATDADSNHSILGRVLAAISSGAFARPRTALGLSIAALALLTLFALRAEFDYERQHYFLPGEAVRAADMEINERLGGINYLDVMVSASTPGGLMTPEAMQSIAALRRSIGALPLVANVSAIDRYISLMHSVLTDEAYGTLPENARGPGQYLFLYETSGAPEDFKQVIDYDHSRALIRAQLSTDSFLQTRPVVQSLEQVLTSWSKASGLGAQVSGRVAVNDGWMSQLAANHFVGLGLAAGLVLLTALAVFRSLILAMLAMLPVLVGVLTVYATMGALGIAIAPATSMTAAIATGLGVDFGIHLVFQMRHQLQARDDMATALTGNYATVARACFWSATSLGVALAVVCLSSAPPLRWFGVLVSLGAFGSLIGALIIIPALTAFASLVSARKIQYA